MLNFIFLFGIYLSFSYRKGYMGLLSSFVSITGISLGIAILIVGLNIINGFEYEFNNRILNLIPHGEIELVNGNNWHSVLRSIAKLPEIVSAIPYVNLVGLIKNNINKIQVIQIHGFDFREKTVLNRIFNYIQDFDLQKILNNKKSIILGYGIANNLKIKNGDWVDIVISDMNTSHNKFLKPKVFKLKVSGIFRSSSSLDQNLALIPLQDIHSYLNLHDKVSGIAFNIQNPFLIKKLVKIISKIFNTQVFIHSWTDKYGYIYQDIQTVKRILLITILFVMIVAVLNLIFTLITAVQDKDSDIAILRIIGAKNTLIYAIFIWYGLVIGITGIIGGVVIGILISTKLTYILNVIFRYHYPNDIYFINFLPFEIHWQNIIIISIISLLLVLISSWYPAYYACQITPTLILRQKHY